MNLYVKEIKVDFAFKPKERHFEGGGHLYYHLGKQWLVFKCREVYFTSHTDFSTGIDSLKTWMATGTMTLQVIRNSSTNYAEWDGDNTSFTVGLAEDGIKDMQKVSPYNGDVWKIGFLVLNQVG